MKCHEAEQIRFKQNGVKQMKLYVLCFIWMDSRKRSMLAILPFSPNALLPSLLNKRNKNRKSRQGEWAENGGRKESNSSMKGKETKCRVCVRVCVCVCVCVCLCLSVSVSVSVCPCLCGGYTTSVHDHHVYISFSYHGYIIIAVQSRNFSFYFIWRKSRLELYQIVTCTIHDAFCMYRLMRLRGRP